MTTELTARMLARVLIAARVELLSAEVTLNSLNVFPVPDGDTGTNMRATLDAGVEALFAASPLGDAARNDRETLRRVVASMTRRAQGNSGVILSEYVRGFLRAVPSRGGADTFVLDGPGLAACLRAASTAARGAVENPVEGTILSVARVAADAGERCVEESLGAGGHPQADDVAQAAASAAAAAVARSPGQIEALAASGVVDSGGAGLALVLEALSRVADGRQGLPRVSDRSWLSARGGSPIRAVHGCHVDVGGGAFEVVAVVEGATTEQADDLRVDLAHLGDSVVVAGEAGLFRVHVHTDAVLPAISRMRQAGAVDGLQVTRFDGPLEVMRDVRVAVRDDAVRAYAAALGATALDFEGRQEPETGDSHTVTLLCDRLAAGGATGNLIAVLHALEERAAGLVAPGVDGVVLGDEAALGDEAFWDEADDDIEILRADSWRAARDLVRTHLRDVESVLACVPPDEPGDQVSRWMALMHEEVGADAHVVVLRLDAGCPVLMEVVHG